MSLLLCLCVVSLPGIDTPLRKQCVSDSQHDLLRNSRPGWMYGATGMQGQRTEV